MKSGAYLLVAAGLFLLQPAAEAKTLTFCAAAGPEGFDPAPFAAAATFDATRPIYNRLVQYEPGTNKIGPALATAWEVSADGLEYTFHLRPGVKFHTTVSFTPTRELAAEDVVFSFDRQKKKSAYFDYQGGVWPFYEGLGMADRIKSIDAVDPATVRFVLAKPDSGFLADLTMDFASIVSKEYADKLAAGGKRDGFNLEPVGTGPFQFVEYQSGGTIRYQADADYWGGRPPVDELDFLVEPDQGKRLEKLKAKECQVMASPAVSDIAAIATDPGLAVIQQDGINIGYLAPNTLQKPFDDVRVRKALGLAIDRQAIVDQVFKGAGAVANGLVPPNVRPPGSAATDGRYDPDAAKQLLDEAGVKDLTLKVWAPEMARPYNPDGTQTAELIKADLAKVGIKVDVVALEWGQFIRKSGAKDRDGAVLYGWDGVNGDPDGFLGPLLGCDTVGGANRANWCNKDFDALVKESAAATLPGERESLFQQAEALVAADQPVTPLARSLITFATTKAVKDLKIDITGRPVFDRADLTE
jgi:dipeptide transport system substrate-binding protein